MIMKKILRLSLVAILSLICGTGFAQTTFDFTALYGNATISDITEMPQTVDGITVSFAKCNSQILLHTIKPEKYVFTEEKAMKLLTDVQ